MAEFDHGLKMIASTSGPHLARLAGVEARDWAPLESTLPATTELLADRAFRARQGRERFVVYFEFYTNWDRNAPWGLLAKAGLLSERERLPTLCIALILRKRGYRPQNGTFQLTVGGRRTQQVWFHEVCLWKEEPQDWWEDVPGLMALYPLCDHGQRPREAIRHAAEVIERTTTEPSVKADSLFLLGLFGGLAYPRLGAADIIGREKMKESRFIRDLREELREEARVVIRRTDVLDIVEARFGTPAREGVAGDVEAINDFERLGRLHRLAATCSRLEEFRAALAAPTPAR